MGYVKTFVTSSVVAAVALGLGATSAAAGEHAITAFGFPYTGGISGSLEFSNATFSSASGQAITCNQSTLSGSISNSEAGAGTTTNGSLTSLTFSQNGNSFCPSTYSGTSSCEIEANNLPYTMRWNTSNHVFPLLSLTNVSLTLHCNSFIGRVECSLHAPTVDGTIISDHIQFFGVTFFSRSGFPCPSSGSYTAAYDLRTSPGGGPVTLTEQ